MEPLVPATFEPGTLARTMEAAIARYRIDPDLQAMIPNEADYRAELKKHEAIALQSPQFVNDTYHVMIHTHPKQTAVCWLTVKRQDRGIITSWSDLQAIKSQLLGAEAEAIDLMPAESRLADSANQYHLWQLQGGLFDFPKGYKAFVQSALTDAKRRRLVGHNLWVQRDEQFTYIGIANRQHPQVRDWRLLQHIKNEIVGKECEGVELFPAESECLHDDRFHLIVFNDPDAQIPVGFTQRFVSDLPMGNAVNRSFWSHAVR